MEDILIPCPKCGKELRLRDPKLLGKIGKCPKCAHRFKLEEPDEVELELADHSAVPVGTSAQWVPDGQPAAAPAVSTTTAPATNLPTFPEGDAAPSSMQRLRSSRKKKPDKVKIAVIAGSIVSAIAVVVVILVVAMKSKKPESPAEGTASGQSQRQSTAVLPDDEDVQQVVESDKPPQGKPITLNFIPTGARMIIHLRPAEIWETRSDAETVQLCLGSLGTWTKQKLTEVLLFAPSEIEEATICLFLNDRNTPPEVAYRVKLTKRHLKSEFIEKFGGTRNDGLGHVTYETDATDEKPATAYMLIGQSLKEFAAAPQSEAKAMVNAELTPGYASGGVDQLLKRTDDRRHLTVVFAPADLRNFKEYLFPDDAHVLLGHFLDRFEDSKMDTMAWSFHFGDKTYDKFYSDILLRNKTFAISSHGLKGDMIRKLKNLAAELLAVVELMTPKTVGERKLVGRLPAMSRAFYLQTMPTSAGAGERWVRLTTVLPKRAGPNLAAASLFAWRMALTTDFTKPLKKPLTRKIPELIADRLKLPVDVDFRRMPLQNAIKFIGEETHIRIEIDGDALKDSGYTKNMPQTMNLGTVSGVRVLSEILKEYKQMVVSVDEKKNILILTTKKFAAKNGQPPFELIK